MEEIKRNPLPKLECGMAYLAHPYAPYAPVAKSSKVFAKVFAGEIEEIPQPDDHFSSPCVFILGKKRYGRNGDSPVRF